MWPGIWDRQLSLQLSPDGNRGQPWDPHLGVPSVPPHWGHVPAVPCRQGAAWHPWSRAGGWVDEAELWGTTSPSFPVLLLQTLE